jgi:hypothetical protein
MAGRDACCAFRLVGGGVGDAVRASWRNPTFQVLLENSFQDARDTDTMPRLRRFLCALFCLIVQRLCTNLLSVFPAGVAVTALMTCMNGDDPV